MQQLRMNTQLSISKTPRALYVILRSKLHKTKGQCSNHNNKTDNEKAPTGSATQKNSLKKYPQNIYKKG